jgi:hypothetical protein
MEQFQMDVLSSIHARKINVRTHDILMWQIWDIKAAKNLYAVYGNKPVCNEPLVSKEQFQKMAINNLLDYTSYHSGSIRIFMNWHKATAETSKKNIEANRHLRTAPMRLCP